MLIQLRKKYQYYFNSWSKYWWVKMLLSLMVLSIGCGVGGIKYWISRVGEDSITKDEFGVYANSIFTAVTVNWANALLAPQMVANLFLTNYSISYETFARFALPPGFWSTSFDYLQAVQFIPYVPDEEREAFETAAQCAHPGYYIREQGPNGTFIPAKHRPEHFPVYYNEPYKGNEAAMGLDNAATSNRYAAFNTSRNTGEPSLSSRIFLVQNSQYGVLLLVPIFLDPDSFILWYPNCVSYSPPFPLLVRNTTSQIYGFVNAVIVTQGFFSRAVSTLAVADVDIFLFDVTDDTITTGNNYLAHVPGQFKYSTPSDYVFGNTSITPADLNRASMDIVRQQIVVAAGRQWLVYVGARTGYFSAHRTFAPLILLLLSVCTSVVPIITLSLHLFLMRNDNQVEPTSKQLETWEISFQGKDSGAISSSGSSIKSIFAFESSDKDKESSNT